MNGVPEYPNAELVDMREEDKYDSVFKHRKFEMLEGKVRAQKKTIESLISAQEHDADIINDHKSRIEALEQQVKAINGAKLGPIIPLRNMSQAD
jgi:hypothetical protein